MTPEPDDYVIERVREALAHDPVLAELDVTVSIRAGKVFLSGTVATAERHVRIGQIAEQASGGMPVCNETKVSTLEENPEPERLT
ncbi:MAG TPA: BON domain-containing protein [Actinomycetota bacterium]|nr:BON domain-containing protein [Actinomycetota bacterium]